jgi:nicotinamide mononucleotide adenylyltransferase
MKLMKELQIPVQTPLEMICDNLSAIHLAQNPVHHGQVKHVAIEHHWIREHVQSGTFKMKHVYTGNMIADILTKNPGKNPFNKFQQMIGLTDSVQIEGNC